MAEAKRVVDNGSVSGVIVRWRSTGEYYAVKNVFESVWLLKREPESCWPGVAFSWTDTQPWAEHEIFISTLVSVKTQVETRVLMLFQGSEICIVGEVALFMLKTVSSSGSVPGNEDMSMSSAYEQFG